LPSHYPGLIIAAVVRRIHVKQLRPGEPIALDRAEAHHARHVLRLPDGSAVEVFDDAGLAGEGVLHVRGDEVTVLVAFAVPPIWNRPVVSLTVAAAVPKGDRADWLVEKLSELGVVTFIPLAAARSVVLPEGRGKRDRWNRISTEAAKQSRRAGVMRITELTALADALRDARPAWFLSTEAPDAVPIVRALGALPRGPVLTAFVGPEGGWTDAERQQFLAAGATPVRLTHTILRVETAAVATAAIVASLDASAPADDHPPMTAQDL
jgi:16S rRNA (uracil1498-N3)-methyltransferase